MNKKDIRKNTISYSAEEEELLLLLLNEEAGDALHEVRIARVEQNGPLPLSFAQQRLWFLEQWEPGTGAYLIAMTYWLKGPLQIRVLEESIQQIVQRHEVLRTHFSLYENEPIQVIIPS